MLIECDPSIKSIIVNIDSANHDYIIEDLDDQHVVVKENMVAALKRQLDEVSSTSDDHSPHFTIHPLRPSTAWNQCPPERKC